jgi:hypothetical protein
MTLLRLQAAASRLPGLLDLFRVLWLVPHQLLAGFAVCSTAAAASVLSARSLMAGAGGVAEREARAGDDLYLGTALNQGRRAPLARRVRLTQRDRRLLALLLDVRFLSTSQLVLLGFGPSGERAGQRRLKLLYDGGFVDRFRSPRAAGSSEWTYRLAARGFKELAAAQMTGGSRRYEPPASDVRSVRHHLELAALVLRIALDAGAEPAAGLIDCMPFQWRGPHSGRIERTASARLERSEAATLAPGTRVHPEQRRRSSLKPDATLIGGSSGSEFAVLLEYDSSLRAHKHADRLRRYDAWLLEGWRQRDFAAHAVAPVVFVLTVYDALVGPLIETADCVLSAWQPREHDGPREGTYPARERIVFTSRERILIGDWTVRRVPSLPPSVREQPAVCSPRSLPYDLPLRFSARALPAGVEPGASHTADVATALENE